MPSDLSPYRSLADWIKNEAISFTLGDGPSIDAGVDRLVAALGDSVEVLGLGEPTHQVEALLEFRNRVFRRLVEKHGYTAIAIESSFPRGRLANDYVMGVGATSLEDAIERGFSHEFGAMRSNRGLVDWIRRHNADHADHPVRFDGFDGPMEMMYTDSPRVLLSFVLDYLESIDGATIRPRRSVVEGLLGSDDAWENREAAFDPSKSVGLSPAAQSLGYEARQLSVDLHDRRPELVAARGEDRFLEAVHYAHAARQLLAYHTIIATPSDTRLGDLMGQRDAMQADNIRYIVERERRRGGKVLLFAHNGHLKLGPMKWRLGEQEITWNPAGLHVRGMFGERYRVVGLGVGTMAAQSVGRPEPGTLEHLLAADGSSCLIATHLGQGLPAEEIAALPERDNPSPGYFPFTGDSFTDFDALVLLASAD